MMLDSEDRAAIRELFAFVIGWGLRLLAVSVLLLCSAVLIGACFRIIRIMAE